MDERTEEQPTEDQPTSDTPASDTPAFEQHSEHEPATEDMADAWSYSPNSEITDDDAGLPAPDDSDAPVSLSDNGHMPVGEGMGDIRAENVTLTQGGARDIDATSVSIMQGGAARVSAQEMSISQGGVGMARTEELEINEGGSAFAVVADKATIEEGSNVFLLVAGQVDGDGRPVLDWRSALAAGIGFAAALSVIRRILR
jgi:hypothetical protein